MVYRQQIAELVALAVPEGDPERRRQLLEEADHWGRLLRSQRRNGAPGEARSFAVDKDQDEGEPAAPGGLLKALARWRFPMA
jgi:hypothetical protein